MRSANLLFVLSPMLFTACAESIIIPFHPDGPDSHSTVATTTPNLIGIYRSTRPFEPFEEIGFITFRSWTFDLNKIYAQLRKDAAVKGAEAIIDVRTSGETHNETKDVESCSPNTSCGADGSCVNTEMCTRQPVVEIVSTFVTEGTLVRRKTETK